MYIYIYNSKSLDVVQSLYFGSKQNFASFVSLYLYVPDEGSLLQKYRDCTTSNDFELCLMSCGVMLFLLIIYIYIFTWECLLDYLLTTIMNKMALKTNESWKTEHAQFSIIVMRICNMVNLIKETYMVIYLVLKHEHGR